MIDEGDSGERRVLAMLLRFRRMMGRLLVLLVGLVLLALVGLRRGAAPWAVEAVLGAAAFAALAMLAAPLVIAWSLRKRE